MFLASTLNKETITTITIVGTFKCSEDHQRRLMLFIKFKARLPFPFGLRCNVFNSFWNKKEAVYYKEELISVFKLSIFIFSNMLSLNISDSIILLTHSLLLISFEVNWESLVCYSWDVLVYSRIQWKITVYYEAWQKTSCLSES